MYRNLQAIMHSNSTSVNANVKSLKLQASVLSPYSAKKGAHSSAKYPEIRRSEDLELNYYDSCFKEVDDSV
jgi:hypothetical protein